MRPGTTLATSSRVLRQLRHDPRTIALLLIVPVMLVTLVHWVFLQQPFVFQRIGVPLLGLFPLTSMFLVTSITMLRERVTGTLERLMTMPLAKLDLLMGYGIAFGLVAAVQATLVSLVAFQLLDLHTAGGMGKTVVFAVLNALLGSAFGLFVSAFAETEFQVVQFLPAFLFPQYLLCGLLVPRDRMARGLELISDAFPLTYAYEALEQVSTHTDFTDRLLLDTAILVAATLIALGLGAATLRRRSG